MTESASAFFLAAYLGALGIRSGSLLLVHLLYRPRHGRCIVQLGLIAHVRGVMMDTAFFTGNQVKHSVVLNNGMRSGAGRPTGNGFS